MEENTKSFDGILEKLAIISEALDSMYSGTKTVVFELDNVEFHQTKSQLSDVQGVDDKTFKIIISSNEFIYFLNE